MSLCVHRYVCLCMCGCVCVHVRVCLCVCTLSSLRRERIHSLIKYSVATTSLQGPAATFPMHFTSYCSKNPAAEHNVLLLYSVDCST